MVGLYARNKLSSWWARRWLEALSILAPPRSSTYNWAWGASWESGFTLARTGRVFDTSLEGSTARARVEPSRTIYSGKGRCSITLVPFDDATWGRILPHLAARSQIEAALLAGELPLQVEAPFVAADVGLFPRKRDDLQITCDGRYCDNKLCQHVAALHYLLADFLERDPFLLFELRGRPRARLLGEMHATRRSAAHGVAPAPRPAGGVPLAALLDQGYDAPRGELPALPRPPVLPERLIETLKEPPGWTELASPARLLGSLIRDAALLATEATQPPARPRPARPPASDPRLPDDPRLQRVQQLALHEPGLTPILPALMAVALGLEAARGGSAPRLLEAFDALRPAGAPDLDQWMDDWARLQFEKPGDPVVGLAEGHIGAQPVAVLWRLEPGASLPVRWWCEPPHPEKRAHQRRRLLEALDRLVPPERNVTLVGGLRCCGDKTLPFFDALGWHVVLRCQADEPITPSGRETYPLDQWLPPNADQHEWWGVHLAQLNAHARRLVLGRSLGGAAYGVVSDRTDLSARRLLALAPPALAAPDVFGLGVPAARKAPVGKDQRMPWLTLGALTLGLLDLLGQAAAGPPGAPPWRRGFEAFEALVTMDEASAVAWLCEAARKLSSEPVLDSLFWPTRQPPQSPTPATSLSRHA